jgi:hypothetical protein
MATVKEIITKIIVHTKASPPTIRWNKVMATPKPYTADAIYSVDPETNAIGWYSKVKLDPAKIIDETFVGKIYVAGQHVNTLTDTGAADVVTTSDDFDLSIIDTTAPYKVTYAKLDKVNGDLEIKWSSFRTEHKLHAVYDYTKADSELGDTGVIYYTGDTPFEAKEEFDWGISVAWTKKSDSSNMKNKKMILYSNRDPYFTLEPDSGTNDSKNLTNFSKRYNCGILNRSNIS